MLFPEKPPCILQYNSSLQMMTDFVMLRAYIKELDGKGTHFCELLVQSESCTDASQTP